MQTIGCIMIFNQNSLISSSTIPLELTFLCRGLQTQTSIDWSRNHLGNLSMHPASLNSSNHPTPIVFGLAASRDEESPFAELDALYRQIFTAVANFNLKDILEALSIFFLADAKCVKKSPRNIERFLPGPFSPGRVRITLSDLHSEIGSCQKKKMGPLGLSMLH